MTLAPEDQKPIVDMTVLQGLRAYARSAAFLPQLIDIFEEHGRSSLTELRTALVGQDVDAVRRVAHRFKGSCLNMGAQALASELRRFEIAQSDANQNSTSKWAVEDVESTYANLSSLFEETCKHLKSLH
jgi:histidine phosphotransfer protein HptB